MTEIQIEKYIKMPPRNNRTRKYGREVKWNWPLAKMEVGDSIFVPITEFSQKVQDGKDNVTHHCSNAIRMHVIRKVVDKNYKFSSRQIIEGKKVIGARVWRTA
jgi:hypothetical protein